ncbi:hypothetical protein IWW38_003171, partial [Coemansia aciculifera]
MNSFNDSTDVTLSRLIRVSSHDDINRQSALEQQYGRAQRSASTSHVTDRPEMVERRQSSHMPSAMVTPKPNRARSDTDASSDQRVLRSALRGSRTSPVTDDDGADNSVPLPTTPRKVSFAVAQTSAASSNGDRSESTAPLNQYASDLQVAHEDESIEFRSQAQLLSSQNDNSPERSPDEADATSAELQEMVTPLSQPPAQATRRNVSLTSGGVGGVGMSGDIFRKFAGWAQSSLSPLSPITTHATVPASTPDSNSMAKGGGKAVESMDSTPSNVSLSP